MLVVVVGIIVVVVVDAVDAEVVVEFDVMLAI